MKFGKLGQVGLVSAIALLVATLFTACGTLNVGFLFVATTKQTPGQMEVYEVDSESGGLRTIPTSPFPSGGRNPIAEVSDATTQNLYVVNNDDNNIVQFGIGTDGKLYPQSTVNTPGTYPMAVAINAAGTYLYVLDTLEPAAGCSLTNPCPADIAVYPINSNGSLATPVANNATYPNYWPLTITSSSTTVLTPTGLIMLADGNNVYVTAYNPTTKTGYLFGFCADSGVTATSGVCNAGLTPEGTPIPTLPGTLTPLNLGGKGTLPLTLLSEPAALVSDTGSANLYVADQVRNVVSSFAVQSGSSTVNPGALTAVGTAATGDQPVALTLYNDKFLYVANAIDSTVTGYSVSSGALSNFGTFASSTNPIAIIVDPRNNGFLYTVNFLGSSLSGYQINPSTGALVNTKSSPYASSLQPTAVSGVPHGGTATASGAAK